MEDRKEKNAPWLSVPQFGEWDQKGPLPDYSLDFSKIREMRKQNKRDPSRASLGNDEELISSTTKDPNNTNDDHQDFKQNQSPTKLMLIGFNSVGPWFDGGLLSISRNIICVDLVGPTGPYK